MRETIQDGKFVELTYKVTDSKSGLFLSGVEFPLGYIHGHNEVLAPHVHAQLEGKCVGDVIEVPIDGNMTTVPGTSRSSSRITSRMFRRSTARSGRPS